MAEIRVNIQGVERVVGALDRTFAAALKKREKRTLVEIADRVIADIRRGDWFTNETGKLKNRLYRSKPRLTKSSGEIDIGWGGAAAVYGRVLETGPKVQRWEIKPRGTTAKGTAVKALRWTIGGGSRFGTVGVRYAKRVIRVWRPNQLRPHFKPVLINLRGWISDQFENDMRDAARDAGLL